MIKNIDEIEYPSSFFRPPWLAHTDDEAIEDLFSSVKRMAKESPKEICISRTGDAIVLYDTEDVLVCRLEQRVKEKIIDYD